MGGALLIMLVLVTQGRAATVTGPNHPDLVPTPVAMAIGKKSGRIGIYGDKCNTTTDCLISHGFTCDDVDRSCVCSPNLPATNHVDKCGKEAGVNETCRFNEQCTDPNSQCHGDRCICKYDMTPVLSKEDHLVCTAINTPPGPIFHGDPAMIGVLIAMGIMFIVICIVLRLFSKARWRDNRTIFNTPNPRLMNVSLLRDNKNQERRGSKSSNHPPPSRQPSLSSLRPQSPAAHSQGSRGSRPGSKSSTGSVKSPTPSAKQQQSNHQEPESTHKLNTEKETKE